MNGHEVPDWAERLRAALGSRITLPPASDEEVDLRLSGRLAHLRPKCQEAAVLILLAELGVKDGLSALFIRRPKNPDDRHSGQIAFPGGRIEPGEAPVEAALREMEEEIGLPRDSVEILGELPGIPTVATGFWITPIVGRWLGAGGGTDGADGGTQPAPELKLDPQEAEAAFWVPISHLQDRGRQKHRWFESGSLRIRNYVYEVSEPPIWGATGALVAELLTRLK